MNPSISSRRPNAATRRIQLLDAADAVFSTHGVHAPLELVVERAGVGRATLYRQFPDRHALLFALMERSIDRLQEQACSVHGHPEGFFALLGYLADRVVHSPALADYWRSSAHQQDLRFTPLRVRAWEAFAPALAQAKAAGLVHADVQQADLPLLSGMLGAALRGATTAERERLAQRALELIITGLRPRG